MILDILVSSTPLLIASIGSLFSEYAGVLAVFMDGMINFSGFLTFTFTTWTGNIILSVCLSSVLCTVIMIGLATFIETAKMHPFMSATALNLLFSSLCSALSSVIFHTRGVLTSNYFSFDPLKSKIGILVTAIILVITSLYFLFKTPHGLYLRITGSDPDVLNVKGINPVRCRIYSWGFAAFFASIAGSFLAIRINSYVPNISGGRGWIALAAVYLGRKNLFVVAAAVIIFTAVDYAGISLQSVIPSGFVNALPYLTTILLIAVMPTRKN